jgi:hypothetical protein
MWMRPGGRAVPFTATEHFEIERVAFSWLARFPVLGPIGFQVVDGYDADRGLLELRLFGVRVRRQAGPELALGEALRYLAELPWVPHAMARNRELAWQQVDERTVEVAADVAGERAALTMGFDATGDIVHVSALRRRQAGKTRVETPWAGDFSEYEVIDGIRMPAAAEVYWDPGGDRFVYWRGRVLSASAR